MISVEIAEQMILSQVKDFGIESLPFEKTIGRVLGEDIMADRDLPPFDRVTMDGIAISYEAYATGTRLFRIKATQAAGDEPIDINSPDECMEIMTGAALPATADTVIRYEDLNLLDGTATIVTDTVIKKQNVHHKGKDKKQNELLVSSNRVIDPTIIAIAASVGKTTIKVKKLPKVVVISTGDELAEVNETPTAYQIRRSNSYSIKAALQQYGIAAEMDHLPDDEAIIKLRMQHCLEHYDVILLSGGISMGKFDHIPKIFKELSVNQLFHKVQQRPGKPFWFGAYKNGTLAFAFPGNPVSTFMCFYRYFIPWLEASLGIQAHLPIYAMLYADVSFSPALQYFLPVSVTISNSGQLLAQPVAGNGSGDFANLPGTNAFMELPQKQSNFRKGEVYPIWPFKQIAAGNK